MRATPLCAAAALAALALPAGAAAKAKDSDRDGMPNKWEVKYHLNSHKNDARKDKDRDGLSNVAEFKAHTNPRKSDTDGDGIKDGNEQAGTVASFDSTTGLLTINLAGGQTLTGKVDSSTEIECDDSGSMAQDGDNNDDNGGNQSDDKTVARNGADDGPNHDQGDDNGGNDQGEQDQGNCGTEALTTGRQVKEAEITGDGTSTIFEKVELGPAA
jgi:opacity protein-like surface antigen